MSKVLIVEDNLVTANATGRAITDLGHEVIIAQDGYLGTKFAFDKNPDLIILDLALPGGGGFSVLKNIRLSVNTRHIPVVVVTGSSDEQLKKDILGLSIEAYLEKPVELGKLIEAVKKVLEKGKK
ncbi:MAG: response regulator [Candidatus Omnitrophica bacterium]|nr:response regulator [Candidatus Omnitrophota bacterium]MDD5611284.1 response regulator [Candidatus Omnitrophota bacterium]